MPVIPASTKTSLPQRLRARAKQNWPQLAGVHVRYHGQFAYVTGELTDVERFQRRSQLLGGVLGTLTAIAAGCQRAGHHQRSESQDQIPKFPHLRHYAGFH